MRRRLTEITSSEAREGLVRAYVAAAEQARTQLGVGTAPEPVVILRASPVGYRVDRFTPAAATVAIWRVGIVGSGATAEPQQSWRTETVSLVWEKKTWKVAALRSEPGPTPPLPTSAATSTPASSSRRSRSSRSSNVSCRRSMLDAAWLRLACALLVATFSFAAQAPPAQAQIPSIPNPCDLPGPGLVCDVAGDLAGDVAGAAADFVMRGVTVWVTNAAVWVTGKVGEFINATSSPDVGAAWFVGQYRSMLATAGVLALPMLLLAAIQALLRQDAWILLRSAFGYLPMAFILAGAAVVGTDLLVSITDDLSAMVTRGLGDSSDNLLESVGQAYSDAIEDDSAGAVPLFGVFLGAIILAIGAFVLWLEMVIRDAAIYIALFFVPLTFVAMIWPATSRYARRLVEFLIAVILAKFVIVAIIGLASAAITNAGATGAADDGQMFERMIAGAALLVLAAWSPFALLRLIPMMEIAAASVVTQRSSMSGAAGSAGVHSPASYMRQAMDRHSHGVGIARRIRARPERSTAAPSGARASGQRRRRRHARRLSDRHTAQARAVRARRRAVAAEPRTRRPSRRAPGTTVAPPRDESERRARDPERRRPPEPPSDSRPPTEDR